MLWEHSVWVQIPRGRPFNQCVVSKAGDFPRKEDYAGSSPVTLTISIEGEAVRFHSEA